MKGSSKKRCNKGRVICTSNRNVHVCKVCGVGFKTGVTLKFHLAYYGDPTYPCGECGTKFTNEKQLDFHVRQTHMLKPIKNFKFQCPACGQHIMTTYLLKSHMYHYHEGWENTHSNLFDSKPIPNLTTNIVAVNNENVSSSTVTLMNDNYSTTSRKNHDSPTIPLETDSSSMIPSKNNISSTLPSETDMSEKLPPAQNITSMISLKNDISAKSPLEQNSLSTIPLQNISEQIPSKRYISSMILFENGISGKIPHTHSTIPVGNITMVEKPGINIKEAKALGNKITETMASEMDSTEYDAVDIRVTEKKRAKRDATEIMASNSKITEASASESNITESTASESNITESMAPESKKTGTKAPESNITETKWLEENTAETQFSETKANAPSLNSQNHINHENKKSDESSWLVEVEVSANEKAESSQKITAESDVLVKGPSSLSVVKMNVELNEVETLLSVVTPTVSEENDQNEKSDASQRHEEADKSDTSNFIESIATNVVMLVAGESNRDNAAEDSYDTTKIDRETRLKVLHSCKDCYVPLPRLIINRKKKRRRKPPKIIDCLSSSTSFPRRSIARAPSIDVSAAKPKYRKIVSGPSTPFPCDHCNESFNTHASRMLHVDLRHTVIPSIVCDKTFTTRQAMLRHYRERHFVYTKSKTFCVCGMELVGQTAIHRHFYQYAITANVTKNLPPATRNACYPLPRKFDCVKCGSKFWLKSCLEYHQTLDCERTRTVVREETTRKTSVRKHYKRTYRPIRPHVCSVCETVFSNAQQLASHDAKHSRREKHQCKICGTVFNGIRLLAGHIQTTHERDPAKHYPYYCRICDQGFTMASAERIHRMHFHRDGVWFANEDTSDSDRDELPMTDSDVSDDETTKECNVCGHEFTSGQRYVNHLVYYTRSEIIECGICLEEFGGQYQAHRHNKLVHYTSESRNALTHYCTICREGFMWKTHLHAHLCHVHGIPAIEAQCMMNLFDSKRSNSQKVGFLNVTDTCKICDITFPSPVLLAAHEIENLNDGEFVCNKCSRRCRTASILLDHLSLNHSCTIIQDGVKCRRCNEKFQTRSAWVSHVKHFHFSKEPSEFYFEKNIASSEKFTRSLRYELNVPTNSSISSGLASFRIKSSFGDSTYRPETIGPDQRVAESADDRNFIKLEAANSTNACRNNEQMFGLCAETPWKCAVCLVSFPEPAELARHTVLFSDEGHYMCELCGQRFAWLSIYQEHKKKHYRSDVDKFFCPTCNEGFKTLQSKTSHVAHLHKRSSGVNRPEDRNIVNLLPSKSPNNARSLTHPKLPSIVSFFQSSLANDQRLNRSLPGPEQIKPDEQYNETSSWPRLHTEIFKDELSLIYQCPDCQEKYPTLEGMHEHLIIDHNMKKDPTEVRFVELSESMPEDSAEGYPEATPKDFPDDSSADLPVDLAACLSEDLPLVSTTFVDSVKCDICDMHFVSENLLSVHRNTIHSSRPGLVRKIRNTVTTVRNRPSGKRFTSSYDHTYDTGRMRKLLPNGRVPKRRYQIRNRSNQSKYCKRKRMRDAVNATLEKLKMNIVRCDICDIAFMNKKVLQAHEVNVHGRIVDVNQSSDDSGRIEINDSSTGTIQQLSLSVGKLPIAPKDVDAISVNIDFESVMPTVTNYDFTITSPETDKSSEMPKPIEDSSSNVDADSLPPANYNISQLKVRPFAKIVQKLRNQNVQKLQKVKAMETSEFPVKLVKKVFDPVAYRELCKQHNLKSSGSKKSRALLLATEPEKSSTWRSSFLRREERR